jgi:hypothetical protein
MAITDHIAILTQFAIAFAVPNKKKPTAPPQFYAVIAFPPSAMNDLLALATDAATPVFGSLRPGLSVGVKVHSAIAKPFPGIPADWFIVRAASNYGPDIFNARGEQLIREDLAGMNEIKKTFYAGKRVRASISGWAWTTEGGGVAFNLHGIMDAGEGGDRLAIGGPDTAGSFAKHANPNAPAAQTVTQSPVAAQPAAAAANPFGGAQAGASGAQGGANPFAQPNGSGNPFGQ